MPKLSTPPRPLDMNALPALATIAQTCKTLSISRATCGRWIEAGRLDVVKVGRSVRVKSASIAALAA